MDRHERQERYKFISRLLEKREKIAPEPFRELLLEVTRERDLYWSVLEGLIWGVMAVDNQRRLRFANAVARHFLSWEETDALPQPMTQYPLPEPLEEIVVGCLQRGERCIGREVATAVGVGRLFAVACVPVTTEQWEGALLLLADITDQRMAQLSASQEQRLASMTHLAAGLAHEISNPLNSLSIYVDLLRRQLTGEDELEKVAIIREELGRLNDKLRNFLKAVRPSQLHADVLLLEAVLSKTVQLLGPECEAAGVQVEYEPPSPRLRVLADAEQLRSALVNLMRNAIQAMPGGGTLSLAVEELDHWLEISVSDTGVGIEPEELSRIFEPYYTTRPDGTGLGLAEVDRIIRQHNGTIAVDSEPGKGTCFALRLPKYVRPPQYLAHEEEKEC